MDYQRTLDLDATRTLMGNSLGTDGHGRHRLVHFAAMRAERARLARQGRHADARTLLRIATGTVWTPARVNAIFGIQPSGCPLCGCPAAAADLKHYLLECPAVNKQREEFLAQQEGVSALDTRAATFTRALLTLPDDIRAPPRAARGERMDPPLSREGNAHFSSPGARYTWMSQPSSPTTLTSPGRG